MTEFHPYTKEMQIGKSSKKKTGKKIEPGKKTLEWDEAREKLKEQFDDWGITSCELQMEGCWKRNGLSFAHIDKRKNLLPGELMSVILACVPCHQKIEKLPSQKMRSIIEKIIENRIT